MLLPPLEMTETQQSKIIVQWSAEGLSDALRYGALLFL